MSTKNNPLFESPTPAITPLALRPSDAAALKVSERLLLEWRKNHGRHYAPPTSTFLSKLFITETCQ